MKIAMVVPSLKNTAPNNLAFSICKYGKKNNIDIDLFYLDKTDNYVLDLDIKAKLLDNRTILDNYDIIHSHGLRPDLINIMANKNIIKVSTIHSFITDDLKNRYGLKGYLIALFWLKLLKKFNSCIAISKSAGNFYIKNNVKCYHIYNGVDFKKFNTNRKRSYSNSEKEIKIVTIAHLEKIKGLEQLLYLAALKKNVHVHIIGEGSHRKKLLDLIIKLDISERVVLHGYLNNASSYLDDFNVYVQPSLSEGFGIAVIEALAAKIPTVCSDIEVFRELFNSNEVDFFKLNDIESLFNAVARAAQKSNIEIDRAAISVYKRFSSEVMSLNYIKWYKKLYEEKNF
ncbi:TPA: glycosyltransferase family 4 protein [Salmonella enterica subsp. salamae serovar 52:z:z39]|uniref:Glycosyltransferase n=1 Tax=Salmonella diarizonae TaxID=59204 RepID=A0A5Y1Y1D8_SALDZ|nr:glycosyltransferase [Salmonella enterica subsp. diarizonae]HCM1973751.1 glycosyltransferase family 4 protein [Salmonella enterica subsp. salamae serovar 52:z:z39]